MPNPRLPPLNAIRAFEAAAQRGSFVEAAAELNVTHWAIGKQVKLLEEWLGVPLFERRSRGVALTDEGAELLRDVSGILPPLGGDREAAPPGDDQTLSGLVRVNVQPSFAVRWLFPRLADFQELFPGIDVRISTTSRKLRYVGTAFDIGVRSAPDSLRDSDARSAQTGLQSGAFEQTSDRRRARSSPSHDPAFCDDAIGLVALAVSSRQS